MSVQAWLVYVCDINRNIPTTSLRDLSKKNEVYARQAFDLHARIEVWLLAWLLAWVLVVIKWWWRCYLQWSNVDGLTACSDQTLMTWLRSVIKRWWLDCSDQTLMTLHDLLQLSNVDDLTGPFTVIKRWWLDCSDQTLMTLHDLLQFSNVDDRTGPFTVIKRWWLDCSDQTLMTLQDLLQWSNVDDLTRLLAMIKYCWLYTTSCSEQTLMTIGLLLVIMETSIDCLQRSNVDDVHLWRTSRHVWLLCVQRWCGNCSFNYYAVCAASVCH